MSESRRRALQVFEVAMTLEESEQARFLDRECVSSEVRAEVESLLDTHRRRDEVFLGRDVSGQEPRRDGEPLIGRLGEALASARVGLASRNDDAAESFASREIGKYHAISALGSGGQADVYRAFHPELEREVVIKISRRELSEDLAVRDRVLSEGRLLAKLDHPGLARVFDFDVHEGRPFLVLEFIRGRDLLQAHGETPFTPRTAARVVGAIARTIAWAHERSVTHLDLKPQNVLIDEAGEIRVIDFGISRISTAWSEDRVIDGKVSGTLAYMASEQTKGESDRVGTRTDVFGLGAILYFLLVGHGPYSKFDSIEALERAKKGDFDRAALQEAGAPDALYRLCKQALACNPGDRPASASEVARRLEGWLRRPLMATVAASLLVVLVSLAIALKTRGDPPIANQNPADISTPGYFETVLRDREPIPLHRVREFRNGDEFQVRFELPADLRPALVWLDSDAVLHSLPFGAVTTGSTQTIAHPDFDRCVSIEGSARGELLFVCASRSAPDEAAVHALLEDVEAAASPPLGTLIYFGPKSVTLAAAGRGPGVIRSMGENALDSSTADYDRNAVTEIWKRLRGRFEWVGGIGFRHGDEAPDRAADDRDS